MVILAIHQYRMCNAELVVENAIGPHAQASIFLAYNRMMFYWPSLGNHFEHMLIFHDSPILDFTSRLAVLH
jgi:hypothetical protein